MTREEALKRPSNFVTNAGFLNRSKVYGLINEIFDDFESRTCKNCKHFNQHAYTTATMGTHRMRCGHYGFECCHDFGCVKWEAKNV